MPGPASTRIEGGILRRLHRDDRGLASMEFILAAPVILLVVVFIRHANLISTEKIDTMREMRNAAFAEANGLLCTRDFTRLVPVPNLIPDALPAGLGPERITCSSRPSHEGGGDPKRTFVWKDLNDKARGAGASENIAGKLADEKPNLVTAKATRLYEFMGHPRFSFAPTTPAPFRWSDRFTVDDATLFGSNKDIAGTNDVTRRGYDPVLRQEIRRVASGAGSLFDGIFPGAR